MPARRAAFERDIIRYNLGMLKEHGVSIAIGSDKWSETSQEEAAYLASLGIFSNLELLQMWCELTPRMIFPHRKLGYLREGFEASFLVLADDPLEDFAHTAKIKLRVKQGRFLSVED